MCIIRAKGKYILQADKKRYKNVKKKMRRHVGTDKENYDKYGEKITDELDYVKDKPPHY